MKKVIKLLLISVLIPLGLAAAASAPYISRIHKKILGSRTHSSDFASHTTSIISNDEMEDIMKIVKSLEDSGLLLKEVRRYIRRYVNRYRTYKRRIWF